MDRQRRRVAGFPILLAGFAVTSCMGQSAPPPSNPAEGFVPYAGPGKIIEGGSTEATRAKPVKVNPSADVIPLPQHGNANGGVDRGVHNVGVIFGARVYGANLTTAIELFYYVPSNADNLYRDGDYRGSTGRIGSDNGADLGGYYCPAGYAAVGLQGAAGLGVDRLAFICGKIGDLSVTAPLPALGGKGGNAFKDICDRTYSLGFLTGVHLRSGLWMDSIQGLCQAKE